MTKAFLLVPLLVAALTACFEPDVRQLQLKGKRYRLRIQFQYQGYDRESDKLDLSIDPNADSLPGKMMTLIERAEPRRASQIFKKIRDS